MTAVDREDVSSEREKPGCQHACGNDAVGLPDGTSTVCDTTCSVENARFDGFLCGAGDVTKYGDMCRMCYVNRNEALKADRLLRPSGDGSNDSEARHVIMCDTLRPPEASECSDECTLRKNTVSALNLEVGIVHLGKFK